MTSELYVYLPHRDATLASSSSTSVERRIEVFRQWLIEQHKTSSRVYEEQRRWAFAEALDELDGVRAYLRVFPDAPQER